MCNDLLEMYTELTAAASSTPSPSSDTSNKQRHRKTNSAAQNQQPSFISYLDLHEEWKKMEPLLKTEVAWASPPPERPTGGGLGAERGGGGGITGFERDTIEEVLLDMPTNKFKNLAK